MPQTVLPRTSIRIASPLHAELVHGECAYEELQPRQMLVANEYSVLSAGTEVAIYCGHESWAQPPTDIGYGIVGRVREAGAQAPFAIGQRVFYYGSHASMHIIDSAFPVPDGVDPKVAPLVARMGQVAMTGVRIGHPDLGDVVAVMGLGLVGNLCAQLLRRSGCTVIGLDLSPHRLQAAKDCGIQHVVHTATADAVTEVRRIAGPGRCQLVIEATGVPGLVPTCVDLAGLDGTVVLLGTPRGAFQGDATQMLRNVHHAHTHVNLTGGHEWFYPTHPVHGSKHSIARNLSILFDLLLRGEIMGAPLISHCLRPEACARVYDQLHRHQEEYLGVVFDWT
jgi:threonine dehydrogenase-like Zn-dependent dehydrogenase